MVALKAVCACGANPAQHFVPQFEYVGEPLLLIPELHAAQV